MWEKALLMVLCLTKKCILLGWIVFLYIFIPSLSFAKNCEEMKKNQPEKWKNWNKITKKAEQSADNQDYETALREYLEGFKICNDAITEYSIARMYDLSGDCDNAMSWYNTVLQHEQNEERDEGLEQVLPLAKNYLLELETTCNTNSTLEVTCTQENVFIEIDGSEPEMCPLKLTLEVGRYQVKASKIGFDNFEIRVEIVAHKHNTLAISLNKTGESSTSSHYGKLHVECPMELFSVEINGNDYSREITCPGTRELLPGIYEVSLPVTGQSQTAYVVAGETVRIKFDKMDLNQTGILISLRLAPFFGVVQGDVYDKNDEKVGTSSLEGMEPGLVSFAVINELGYAFSTHFSAMIETRFDVVNFSVMISLVTRFTIPLSDSWLFRIDLGGGYGTLLMPVQLGSDTKIYLAHCGPYVGTVALGLGWQITQIFILTLQADVRMGFPDEFGFIFDAPSLGLEVRF